jgi:sigma-E factor negative regulatory protein RseA
MVGRSSPRVGEFMKIPATSLETGEIVSVLADGESTSSEVLAAIAACSAQADMVGRWNTYHLIGEALRSPAAPVLGTDSGFFARFSARLSLEPIPGDWAQAVHESPAVRPFLEEPARAVASAGQASANDRNFRWKVVAGLASLTAVSAVVWAVFGALAPAAAPQLASAPPATEQVLVDSPRGPVMRDARLEELMAAHKQLGATSAQMPSGFLRNATFETPQTGVGR